MAINKALGEKAGTMTFAISMCVAGLAIGFIRGWGLALCMCAIGPALAVGGNVFMKALSHGTQANLAAYAQSAGYAEQAFNAIRVVIAFGMEKVECNNYEKFLVYARDVALKSNTRIALSIGAFFSIIYLCYSYAFFVGSFFVEK
jgi:ABC-type multidrug transport system fused ATPase/permease subunit